MKGTVKWFNNQKGYGFIKGEDNIEYFVHYSGINSVEDFKALEEGQSVTFDVIDTEKGKQATNVEVIEENKGGQDNMMKKEVREEWKQYLFEEEKDYTFEEVIEKVLNAIRFLKKSAVRVTANMFLDNEKADSEFHLSETEKVEYINTFNNMGFAVPDCETIVKVIDVIYHWFDVSKEKAYEMAEYAANNQLTVTQTIKDKMNVNFDEIVEFSDTVLEEMLAYTKVKTVECGKEFVELINGLLLSVE